MMMLFPVPEFGSGVLSKEGNFAAYFDRIFLTGHMWKAAKTWDPEGIFSTIPAICTCLFGILAGFVFQSEKTKEEKVNQFFFWGSILSVLGVIFDMWLPINKSLWTTSYSVYTAGMALLFLAMSYYLIDVKGYKKWATPFLVYGTNAITVFFLSGMVARELGLIKVVSGEGIQIPINNWIYVYLFSIYAAGIMLLICVISYYLRNIKGYKKWATPFLVNSIYVITIFFLFGMVGRQLGWIKVIIGEGISLNNWIYVNLFASWLGPMNGSLGYAICYILLWLGLMWILYAKKIFIKV
jgi:predicted acyltransferase